MDFEMSEDQVALQDTVRRFLQQNYGRPGLRAVVDNGRSFDRDLWRAMAQQLGLHGIGVAEEYGGAGGGLVELAIVLEEMGRSMLAVPFFSTIALAATALQYADDEAAAKRWLHGIVAGEVVATLAAAEADMWSVDDVATVARPDGAGWLLEGRKKYVVDATNSDLLLVPARTPAGLSLFAVQTPGDNVSCAPLPVLDPTRPMAHLVLDNAPGTLVGTAGGAADVLRKTLAVARVGLAAEQLGGIQACLDMAVGYAKTRVQFGRPIGSFQAIKHKCADIFVDLATARCAVYFAAWSLTEGLLDVDGVPLPEVTSAYVSDAYLRAAAHNLQIHGGIGYTWEHDAHLLFKRASSSARLLGSTSSCREAVAASVGL